MHFVNLNNEIQKKEYVPENIDKTSQNKSPQFRFIRKKISATIYLDEGE